MEFERQCVEEVDTGQIPGIVGPAYLPRLSNTDALASGMMILRIASSLNGGRTTTRQERSQEEKPETSITEVEASGVAPPRVVSNDIKRDTPNALRFRESFFPSSDADLFGNIFTAIDARRALYSI